MRGRRRSQQLDLKTNIQKNRDVEFIAVGFLFDSREQRGGAEFQQHFQEGGSNVFTAGLLLFDLIFFFLQEINSNYFIT